MRYNFFASAYDMSKRNSGDVEKYQFSKDELAFLEKSRIPFAVYQFVRKRVVTLVLSEGFCDFFGYKDRAKAYYDMDNNMYCDTHPDDVSRIADAALRFATKGGEYEVIYRSKTIGSDDYRIVHAIGEHVYTPTGERLAYVWYTDEGAYVDSGVQTGELNKRLNEALHTASIVKGSYYDDLTGLPNMTHFFELATEGRRAMLRQGRCPVILFMDFNGMKFFNTKYGFSQGNALLRAFSKLLVDCFSVENCSRFGQDHFVVYADASGIENTLRKLFSECRRINGGKTLTVRVGIFADDGEDIDASIACDRAKLACDSNRNMYLSSYAYYNEGMRYEAEKRRYIVDNLDEALEKGWVQVYYQAIVRAVSGKVCDEEALARWIDPVRGILSPTEFITVLEDAKLSYKLDLYVVERVLQKMKRLKKSGLRVVPQSVNLSRTDFDSCDMVEEIRWRVEAAGIERGLLNIEITESVVAKDLEFIKQQVDRFRELGFNVWMDDFGSGYSSLDVLQSIHFDLIKFDTHFMRKFSKGCKGKIILTELVKMAMGLGIDTICEGVEEPEQVEFLREIGCSKLQGFYYTRPVPLEELLQRKEEDAQIGFENPKEAEYYAAIGRISLYDIAAIAGEDNSALQQYFDTLPMAIVEVRGQTIRYVRCNQSYRTCVERVPQRIIPLDGYVDVSNIAPGSESALARAILQCGADGNRVVVDESLSNGTTAHSFIRRISVNPVTGTTAIAVAVLAVVDNHDAGATYACVARALAVDYFNLYYVNLRTDEYIEYSSKVTQENLAMERHGKHFFANSLEAAAQRVCEADREYFMKSSSKENMLRALDASGSFTLTYQLLVDEEPVYVNMKAVRMADDNEHIIVGVSSVDGQMKHKQALERIRQEEITYARIMALSGSYICVYTVDPHTDHYMAYTSTKDSEGLGARKEGYDFFADTTEDTRAIACPEDLSLFTTSFTKQNVMRDIEENGLYVLRYRLMIGGKPTPVSLRAAIVEEIDGPQLIVGVTKRM